MNARRPEPDLQAVQSELVCPLCDNDGITTEWNSLDFNYGADESMVELSVDVPVHRCDACKFEFLDDEAERLKHEAVCRHLGVLTPAEVRSIRDGFGMARTQFARLTGIGEASLNRWENGLSIQTHAYDRYLRLLTRPVNRSYLEDFLHSTAASLTFGRSGGRFREIEVTGHMRKEQRNFQLRKVA